MAFRYVVKKRVFGFDESKSEKYVAASFSIGEISYDRLCDQVTKEGMAPRGVVKMVMDGLIDALSTYVSLGATVKLGDFGTIRPGLNCKIPKAKYKSGGNNYPYYYTNVFSFHSCTPI